MDIASKGRSAVITGGSKGWVSPWRCACAEADVDVRSWRAGEDALDAAKKPRFLAKVNGQGRRHRLRDVGKADEVTRAWKDIIVGARRGRYRRQQCRHRVSRCSFPNSPTTSGIPTWISSCSAPSV